MVVGWAGDDAVNAQIQSSIDDEVARARSLLPKGKSLAQCEQCEASIPKARQKALPGVRLCIACQEEHDKDLVPFSTHNRKASKNSQLK